MSAKDSILSFVCFSNKNHLNFLQMLPGGEKKAWQVTGINAFLNFMHTDTV